MAQFGSNTGMVSQNLSTVVDGQGNQIVSSDNSFGASPLGVAARTQALYGIPNANFNLTPPDVMAVIDTSNPLPYWEISSQGSITAEMYYDDARQQWSVNLDPTSAGSGDFVTLKTRSYLLNDSGVSLRQKAFATLEKIGTYAGSNEWNLVLTATYFDSTGTQLSTFAIGTVAQNTTWTGINGFTTSGTAIVDSAAAYLDLDFTMTAVATVSGTATAHLDALLIQTSIASGGGASSFLIVDSFTASGTWTRPTGVEYLVAVAGYSGGGGGGGGSARYTSSTFSGDDHAGGAAGAYAIIRDLYVGDQGSVSVGIGAGGAGGLGGTASRPPGGPTTTVNPTSASSGGATTFGSYLTLSTGAAAGSAGTVVTTTPFVDSAITPVADTIGTATRRSNSYFQTNGFSALPYQNFAPSAGGDGGAGEASAGTAGTAGGTATVAGQIAAGGVRTLGGAGGSAGFIAGIGGRSAITRRDSGQGFAYIGSSLASGTTFAYTGGSAQAGAGGGGGAALFTGAGGSALKVVGGDGGNAAANSGSGGGGGGPAAIYISTGITTTNGTAIGGDGGNGGDGYLIVAYVA